MFWQSIDPQSNSRSDQLSRRAFVCHGSLYLLGAGLGLTRAADWLVKPPEPRLRVGLLTDLHYADKPARGSRHYRETLAKLERAAEQFERDQPECVVELGDFIDAAESVDEEKRFLARIQREFANLPGDKHYVLGNHCVSTLVKQEFLDGVEQEDAHYSFDAGGFHFVVLDACYRQDGESYARGNFTWTDPNIPQEQVEWLEADLGEANGHVVVFVHQRLDVGHPYGVNNGEQVREVLESSGKVLAVFQGHSHRNELNEIGGIHYCVLQAMVEGSGDQNNGYATLDLFEDGTIRLTGFYEQSDYRWPE